MEEKFEIAKESEHCGIKLLRDELVQCVEDRGNPTDKQSYVLGLEISSLIAYVIDEGGSLGMDEFARLIMSLYSRGYNSMEIGDMLSGLRSVYRKEIIRKRFRDSRHKPREVKEDSESKMDEILTEKKLRQLREFICTQVKRIFGGEILSQEELETLKGELEGYSNGNIGFMLKALERIFTKAQKRNSKNVAEKISLKLGNNRIGY